MFFETLMAAVVIMLASLAGVLFTWRGLGGWMRNNLRYLVVFSAGVFLATAYNLGEEVFHESGSLFLVLGGVIGGALLLEIGSRIIPGIHHHHVSDEDHDHSKIDARRLFLGDAIHNIGDGILLVPAFLIDVRIGLAAAVAVFIHELVQEVAEFFVFKEAGYSTKKALLINFTVSGTILIGVILGVAVTSIEFLVDPLIAFSAGGFFYIVIRDLLPETVRSARHEKKVFRYVVAGILGIVAMVGVNILTPHSHADDEHGNKSETIIFEE